MPDGPTARRPDGRGPYGQTTARLAGRRAIAQTRAVRSRLDAGVDERAVLSTHASRTPRTVDEVAIEEPLEIRVAGDPLAVTMRTPGADRELTLGFLYSEGIVGSIDDVGALSHCGRPGEPGFRNVIDVQSAPGSVLAPERLQGARRGTLTTAACGVCGRASIDDLIERCAPVRDGARVTARELARLYALMRGRQRLFARTGGVHAAMLSDVSGAGAIVHEDVGRHNAVDKVVGALVLARALPATGKVLLVSGRMSFEIVQKAAVAGVPVVASVSAASSLAIDLAARLNMTLAAFVRDGAMNVYTGAERIVFDAA
jgi:FdhD protein